jgi:hypothetical protein
VDYSIIVAALVTGLFTVGGTVAAARFGKKVAQNAGAAVQTAEQIEAERLIADARTEATRVKAVAKDDADALVASAKVKADQTDQERDGWHLFQVTSLTAERDDLRTEVAALKAENAALRREGTA